MEVSRREVKEGKEVGENEGGEEEGKKRERRRGKKV